MAKTEVVDNTVIKIKMERVSYCVLGKTPIILNRLSEKSKRDLLLPPKSKSRAEKESTLKQNPYVEFRNSPYTLPDGEPTFIAHLATAFKKAISCTAVDIPGAKKAQMGRLMWVEGERIGIYGIPKLFMAITRDAGMTKTPRVRTRSIIPEWACRVVVSFPTPILQEVTVSNLFAAAGMIQGVGDWRPEKGSGSFGQFELVSEDNINFQRIIAEGGRAVQQEYMNNPEPYDSETEDMLAWFGPEVERRGFKNIEGVN